MREHHPVAALFPMLSDDELAELAADIKVRGQLHPIVLDADGRILDGRNRFAACEIAGVEPEFTTYNGGDPDGYALAVNIARRHLSTGARAIIAAKAARFNGRSKSATDDERLSKHRLYEAGLVLDWAPDLAPAVVAGDRALSVALEEARQRKRADEERQRQKARLHADATDLLSLVEEERMSLADAIAALEAREEKARQEAEERRTEAEQKREIERERRRRISAGFGADLVRLMSALDPNPVAFVSRTWDPTANPHRDLANARDFFGSKGVRRLGEHLTALADHLEENGRDLL